MLKPQDGGHMPEDTARIARASFPKGNLAIYLRDEFEGVYKDAAFASLYSTRGQPAEAPWRLALVTILQFAENLSDRQAADAVRSRIDWKYALGLELHNAGFDYTVLSKFRKRLLEGRAEQLLLDTLLQLCQKKQLIKKRGGARSDSTHVLARVKALSRFGNIFEAIRQTLNRVATAASEWLKLWAPKEWYDRYACHYEAFRFPEAKARLDALGRQMGEDGLLLLKKIRDEQPDLVESEPAIRVLDTVLSQQYKTIEGSPALREPKEQVSTSEMLASPYDPDARLGNKRDKRWTGYKMHITETCDEDAVNLVTHVEITSPNRHDNQQIPDMHIALEARNLLPAIHYVDSGYMDANKLVESQNLYGITLCGPALLNNQWQAKAVGAYAANDFQIDWEKQEAMCPNGKKSISWKLASDRYKNPITRIAFSLNECGACEKRNLCTQSKKQGRMLSIRSKDAYEAMTVAREQQITTEWKSQYKKRAGVEGSISQAVRAFGLRRSRYTGFAKTHLQHIAIAAAMNVTRLHEWSKGTPKAKTRSSSFARLVA